VKSSEPAVTAALPLEVSMSHRVGVAPERSMRPGMVVVVGATALADQLTKLASASAGPGWGGVIRPTRNSDFSLGLASAPWAAQVVLMAAGVIVAAVVLNVAVRRQATPGWAAGLVIGGSVSNLTDRALLGSVRDFLRVGDVVLNLADLAVLVGVLAALGAAVFGPRIATAERR
jgi:lipoprotein signal peptidase